jgi:hypothetical protein
MQDIHSDIESATQGDGDTSQVPRDASVRRNCAQLQVSCGRKLLRGRASQA